LLKGIQIDDEIDLEKEKAQMGREGADIQGDKQQLAFLMEQLSSFQRLFDTLSVPEKREYLRMITG
jgi:hypothetical protein